MKVVYQKRALGRLRHIARWLDERSPSAAKRIVNRIEQAIDLLRDFPEIGRQSVRRDVRELVVSRTPYIVHYRVRGDEVRILTIRHSAQRPLKPRKRPNT